MRIPFNGLLQVKQQIFRPKFLQQCFRIALEKLTAQVDDVASLAASVVKV
ncbi:hypothetical protein [Dyadobacter chenwenxiniae]